MTDESCNPIAFDYRAFISYSHSDHSWAKWLLSSLERYKIHTDLVGTQSQNGELIPAKLGKFFRDRDDASASSDLNTEIRRALSASANIIVIASPAAARSRYVDAEIREFHAINAGRTRPGLILTLIVAGEPNVSTGDEVNPRECFPPALRGGLAGIGQAPLEPLAADARPIGDGQTRAIAKLVSGLLSVRYDSLVRRDLVRRRNRWATLGSVAMVLITGAIGISLRVEGDRREKARLEHDRRTLAAVNKSERARAILATGDVEHAVTLGRQSLAEDGSLPFIPQAYSVLYEAYFKGAEPRSLDLVDYDDPRNLANLSLGSGRYLAWSPRGKVSLWNPKSGITYVRNDALATHHPTATPDGTAIFMGSTLGELRYRVVDKVWDTIRLSAMNFDYDQPAAEIALDATSLVACRASIIYGVTVPAVGSGDAKRTWESDLGKDDCSSLSRAPDGTLLIGTWSGDILQFDPTTRKQLVRYRGHLDSSADWVDVGKSYFAASSISHTAIFQYGNDTPLLTFDDSSFVAPLSPDGKYAVQQNFRPEEGQISIHDLEKGAAVSITCICTFEGFDKTGNLLTLEEGRTAAVRDIRTGAVIRVIHNFDHIVNNIFLFGEDDTLLGLREIGFDTIVPRETEAATPLLAARPPGVLLTSAQFVDDSTIALVVSHAPVQSAADTQYDVEVVRRGVDGHARMLWARKSIGGESGRYGEVKPLGHGLLGLLARDGRMGPKGYISIVAVPDGQEFYRMHINAAPESSADGRHVVLETNDGLVVYDLVQRKATPLVVAKFDPPEYRNWALAGNNLVIGSNERLIFQSLDGASKPVVLAAGGKTHLVCTTGDIVFSAVETPEGLVLQRFSLVSGQLTDSIRVDLDNPGTSDVIFPVVGMQREYRNMHIACTAQRYGISGLEKTALVWDVAGGRASLLSTSALSNVTARTSGASLDDAELVEPSAIGHAKLTFDDAAAYLSDQKRGLVLRRFEGGASRIVSATHLRSRGWVAVGLEDGTIRVWDVALPSAPTISLKVHLNAVNQLESNPSGTGFLSADSGGTVRYWPALTVHELLELTNGKN